MQLSMSVFRTSCVCANTGRLCASHHRESLPSAHLLMWQTTCSEVSRAACHHTTNWSQTWPHYFYCKRHGLCCSSASCVTHVLILQALVSMHAAGRGMCDVKPENIMVRLAEDGLTFLRVTLIDLGGSAFYSGESTYHACCSRSR